MRGRILDAAYDILLEKGRQGLSARAIAERLGVAHMALFTYFLNQAAILQALSEREMGGIHAQQAIFEQRAESEDILQVVREALAFFPDYARKNPKIFQIAWVMPIEAGADPEQTRLRAQSHVRHMARIIRIGVERGVFEARDPELAAAAVISMVISPLILFHTGRIPSPEMTDRLSQEVLVAALRYLKKESVRNPMRGGVSLPAAAP
jgi:AcrR family transcriptional regulator